MAKVNKTVKNEFIQISVFNNDNNTIKNQQVHTYESAESYLHVAMIRLCTNESLYVERFKFTTNGAKVTTKPLAFQKNKLYNYVGIQEFYDFLDRLNSLEMS